MTITIHIYDADVMVADGETVADVAAKCPALPEGQVLVAPSEEETTVCLPDVVVIEYLSDSTKCLSVPVNQRSVPRFRDADDIRVVSSDE